MSGASFMFFGSTPYAFVGLWGISLSGPAIASALSVGADATSQPMVAVGGTAASAGYTFQMRWTRDINWALQAASLNSVCNAIDSSQNTYAVYSSGGSNTTLVKFDPSGAVTWQRRLSDASNAYGTAVATDGANAYLIGYTGSSGARAFIAKYDSSGAIQWQRTLTPSGSDTIRFAGLSVDPSGNTIVVGNLNSGAPARTYGFIAKYDSSGAIQWQNSFNRNVDAYYAFGAAVDGAGNSYVLGQTGGEYALCKFDTTGTLQWIFRTPFLTPGNAGGIVFGPDDFIYTCASDTITKIDTSGAIQFARTLTISPNSNTFAGIGVDSTQTIWVLGWTNSTTSYNVLGRLPADGSATGTYSLGSIPSFGATTITYATTAQGTSAFTPTVAATTLTDAAGNLTDAAGGVSFSSFSTTPYATVV